MTALAGRTELYLAPDLEIGRAIAHVSQLLGRFVPDAALEARLLVAAATRLERIDLIRDPGRRLGEEASNRLAHFLERRIAHEPVSRILGSRGFWTLDVTISPAVLDPRPDTETLIEVALRLCADRRNEPLRIVDLGTGSGAILCALLTEFPQATGVGVDLSPAACVVAQTNLDRNGLGERGRIMESNWAEGLDERFDLVVSNPPYIESLMIEALDPDVRDFDPRLALDGGPDGLAAYRAIGGDLDRILKRDALAIFETGVRQTAKVTKLMTGMGLEALGTWNDLGSNDRIVAFRTTRSHLSSES